MKATTKLGLEFNIYNPPVDKDIAGNTVPKEQYEAVIELIKGKELIVGQIETVNFDEKEINNLKEKIRKLEETIRELQNTNSNLEDKVRDLESEIEILKDSEDKEED